MPGGGERRARRLPAGRAGRGRPARRREAASPRRVSVRVSRPWSMKTTRSQTRSTSGSWCEFRTIVAPRAFAARICSRTIGDAERIGAGGGLVEEEQRPGRRASPARRRCAGACRASTSAASCQRAARSRPTRSAAAWTSARGARRVAARQAPVEREEGRAREVAVEAEALGHVAGARADPEVVDRAPVDAEAPGVGPQEPEQAGEQRRLAGAVGADQAERLAAPHLEGDAVERAGAAGRSGRRSWRRSTEITRHDTAGAPQDRYPSRGFREYGLFFRDF